MAVGAARHAAGKQKMRYLLGSAALYIMSLRVKCVGNRKYYDYAGRWQPLYFVLSRDRLVEARNVWRGSIISTEGELFQLKGLPSTELSNWRSIPFVRVDSDAEPESERIGCCCGRKLY